jgi:hypothetical protein
MPLITVWLQVLVLRAATADSRATSVPDIAAGSVGRVAAVSECGQKHESGAVCSSNACHNVSISGRLGASNLRSFSRLRSLVKPAAAAEFNHGRLLLESNSSFIARK